MTALTRVLFLIILTVGCTNSKRSGEAIDFSSANSPSETPEQPLRNGEIDLVESKKIIERRKNQISNATGKIKDFKKFIRTLNASDFYAISTAADYLKIYLPKAGPIDRDSTYLYFAQLFYKVVNNQTDSLYLKYPNTMKKLEANEIDSDTRSFDAFLELFGVELFMTEGTFYLDVSSDYFAGIFSNHVSKGLQDYLQLRKQELNEGFSEDAGLLITFEKVHERILRWEKFLNEHPNSMMINDAYYYFETYLETLLTGLDNSRIFDSENKMLPEIKSLYKSIIRSNANNKSTAIIRGYYEVLAQGEFKYSDSLTNYLKKQGFDSMLGIQPHTR